LKKIVFLVSGGGATLKFVLYSLKHLRLDAEIIGVIADREVEVKKFLKDENIYFEIINYTKSSNSELIKALEFLNPDVIVTNFHKIIDLETLNKFENKFINLHYSLLPAFSGFIGMKTIELAKTQNVGFVGGTCHEVNEMVDAGTILFQGCFSVNWSDDYDVIDSVFKLSCIIILAGILKKLDINGSQIDKFQINRYLVNFSPKLPFQSLDFTNHIWTKLI
jgi:phosphoribosylglycinamide formyltransferase-1